MLPVRATLHALALAVPLALAACASPQTLEIGPVSGSHILAEDHFLTPDGARLPVTGWRAESPRAVIVAVHGFNGYAADFELPGAWFQARGVSLYAFDQRGFGRNPPATRGLWAGSRVMADDLSSFVRAVRARHARVPVYVLGFSMGGAVAMSAAAAGGLEADGLILAAPAVWGWRSMNPVVKSALWLTAHTMPAATATGSGLKITPSDNIDWLKRYSRDPLNIRDTRFDAMYGLTSLMDDAAAAAPGLTTPVLYLYGARDEIVPAGPSREVMAAITAPKRLAVYRDGYHMVLQDRQREVVYRDILSWITDPRASLPSGQEVGPPRQARAAAIPPA